MDENRAIHQDIRPLQICILNLMPVKQDTELQVLRALSNTPLQVDVTFMKMNSHRSLNTPMNHLNQFYHTFDGLKGKRYDGLMITGAPVEQIAFHEVDYWDELCEIMEWSKKNVTSTLHICWGAQAGLYHHYQIPKYKREEKLSGVYRHRSCIIRCPLVRGMDDYVMVPHSRYTEVRRLDIEKHPQLRILIESDQAGIFLVMKEDGSQIFIQGHPEYDRMTLNNEYHGMWPEG